MVVAHFFPWDNLDRFVRETKNHPHPQAPRYRTFTVVAGRKVDLFYLGDLERSGLVAGDLHTIPIVGGKPVNLTNDALGSVHYFNWFTAEDLLILSVNWAKSKFTFLNAATGKFTNLYEGEIGLSDIFQPKFSISTNQGNRKVSVVREELSSPPEVWIADIDRQKNTVEWKQVSELNKELEEKYSNLGARLIQWESFDGLRIQGFLYLPQVSKNGSNTRLPLIVNEHG